MLKTTILRFPLSKAMVDVQWAFISIVTASLAHFILRIVLGRELGADGLGVYTLAFTIYLFGMQFAAFGIGAALTKYVAEFIDDQGITKTYVSSGMISSIITGSLMGIALFILAPYIAVSFFQVPELELLLKLTALCYPFIAIQKAVLGTLNGFRRMHLFALLNIVQNIAIVAVSIALVLPFGMGLFGAVIGFVAPTILVSLLSTVLIWDSIRFDNHLWNTSALKNTTIFGIYFVLGNTIYFFHTQIDSILIGYYLNPTEVGIYAIAVLLAQALTLLPNAVQRVTAPATATLYGKREIDGLQRLIVSTMKNIFTISLGLSILIALSGQYLIAFLFTEEFLFAYFPLLILLVGHIIFSPFSAIGSTLSSIGKIQMSFYIHAITGVLNLSLNIMLIPTLGIIGAAVATTSSLIISFGLHMVVIYKYIFNFRSS